MKVQFGQMFCSCTIVYLVISFCLTSTLLVQVDDSNSADRVEDSQLFLSVPALNQAASYLAQTASFLTQCLPVPGYVG